MTFRAGWLIFVSCLAVSLVVAAMASLNIALPAIAVATGATNAEMTWIIDGYTLVLAALLLPAGALGDRLGRRGVLIAGLAVFGIASLAAIWVDGPWELIGTRFAAGVGAALVMPTTLSLITAGVPRHLRPLGVSIWSVVTGAGAIAGFFVTGLLLEHYSWNSVFISLAAGSVLMIALALTIGTSKDDAPGRFDFAGSVTSVLAVTAVVFGLIEAPHRGWVDALVLVALIAGVALGAAFVVIELRSASPLLDVRLFRDRAFAAGSLSVLLQFFASFGLFYLLMQQLMLVYGYSPLQSAIALTPMVIGIAVFGMLGNWVAVRFDSLRFVLATGIVVAAAGVLSMGIVDIGEYWKLAVMLAVCAVGIGLAAAPSTTAIMANTPLENQGVGSAVNDTARELGAAIGIALAGSIMAAGYERRITPVAELTEQRLTLAGPDAAAEAAAHVQGSLAGAMEVSGQLAAHPMTADLATQIAHDAQAAFLPPLQDSLLVLGSVLLAGGIFLGWFAPRKVLSPERVEAIAAAHEDGAGNG